jgi:polar amino acid transport system substrate-binding protein
MSQRTSSSRLLVAGVAGLLSASLAACGSTGASGAATSSHLGAMKSSGTAKLGIAAEPPYSALNPDGTLSGVAPDIATQVLKTLGVKKLTGVTAQYAELVPGMNAGRWDFVGAALNITADRCKQVLFSDPIVVSTSSLAVLAGNPHHFTSLADVIANGGKVAILQGSSLIQKAKKAGVSDANIVNFPDSRAAIDGLKAGRSVAFLSNTDSLQELKGSLGNGVEITDPLTDVSPDYSALAFMKQDADLKAAFNKEVGNLKGDGTFDAILKKNGFTMPAEYRNKTADDVCRDAG